MAPLAPAPAMVGKETSLRQPGVAAETLQRLDRVDLGGRPSGASRSNQARKRVTAAPSRRCAARAPAISAAFFTAFISAIGSLPRGIVPPVAASRRASARGGGPIEPHRALLAAERGEAVFVSGERAHIGDLSRRWRTTLPSLRPSTVERRPALRHDAKASGSGVCVTSPPRMLNTQATACGSETTSASAAACELDADALELRRRRLRRQSGVVQRHWAERRRRPIGPDRVDRIAFDGNEGRAALPRRLSREARRRRWCAATANSRAGRRAQIGREPCVRRCSTRCSIANSAPSTCSRACSL